MTLTMNEIYDEILRDGGMTPSKKIKQTSIRFPEKIAMRYKEFGVWQETTFEEFWKKSNYLSMGLKFFGIEKGDSVAIHSENRPEWFIADIGIQSLGAVSVGLYPTNPASEVEYLLSHSESKILFAEDQEQVDKALQVIENLPLLEKIVYFEDRGLYSYDHPKLMRFDEFLEIGKSEYESFPEYVDQQLEEINDEDVAFLVYTSGTTSKPKGVLHAHRTILGRKLMKEGWEHYQPDDNVLHAGTLNWTFTLGVGLMDVWLAGGHSHLYNGSKEPKKWIEMIEKYQISIFVGVPTIYRQILKYVEISKKSLSSLRYGLCSGEPLPKEVLKGWQSTVGTDLYEALGMTELSTYISTHKKIEIKPGSPGKPQPGRNIVILPEENGTTPLQANEVGLLASHKSDPGLMLGYWKRPEEEKEVFRGDWFIGGDTASIDEDGYIWFHGRSDEIIKSFGYRVSPVEVEAALDGLDNVNESAVFGMQAHENKTLICAVVVLNSNSKFVEEDIKLTLAETLANYKMPHVIYPIKKIPRTRNGKIKRSQLKKEYANNID